MVGEFTTEGGGFHRGKPMIWPNGKPINTPQTQTTGGVKVPARPPAKTGEAAPIQAPQTGTPAAAPARTAPSIARPLTVEDVRAHLLNIQVTPNDLNTKLASLMLRNGVELSRANFVKLMTMLQGTDKSQAMQEAAVLLLMKGIDSPQAVKILGQYFAQNPGLASQLLGMQDAVGNLISALGMGKGLMDATLVSQLGALLSQFDETFRKLGQKASGKNSISRETMINDVRALKALLSGIQNKAPTSGSTEAQALSSALMQFQGKLDAIMQNMLAQAILSQPGRSEVNYQYHQIPNAMTNPPKDLEIVVKREGEGKKSQVDPRNTQVVMSLETENMGKMVISMYVKDGKVYVIFVFSEKDYGDQGRGLIAKEYGEFVQKLADKNFMITGYQVKVDPAMCKIPIIQIMRPIFDNLLRRIDYEV